MANRGERFDFLQEHRLLLQNAYLRWEDSEYGAPAIDSKRPYGNSNVEEDIAKTLGWSFDPDEGLTKRQREIARQYHLDTLSALEIVLSEGGFPAHGDIFVMGLTGWERVEE